MSVVAFSSLQKRQQTPGKARSQSRIAKPSPTSNKSPNFDSDSKGRTSTEMISPKVYDLCHREQTITSELAKNPSEHPSNLSKRLFDINLEDDVHLKDKNDIGATANENSDVERARQCGNWGGSQPSELFLRIYHDVLCTLETNALINLCSPSLIGSHGVSPLLIVSGIPDICRHMSNLIARAEHEVFIATNFWMISEPSRMITNGLIELSRRAEKSERKPVVKIMYDRGDLKQIITPHQHVTSESYADPNGKIQLPHPSQIPHIELEVVNYHRPPLGTFHSKFMVVDRNVAIVQSDNIQDNDNMEMMVQLEGPIVDSIYETALVSWHNELKPPFPCLNTPAANSPPPSFQTSSHAEIHDREGNLSPKYQPSSDSSDLPQHTSSTPNYDPDIASELLRSNATFRPQANETHIHVVSRHLNTEPSNTTTPSVPELTDPAHFMTPLIPLPPHPPIPIALVNRPPYALPTFSSLHVPQNVAWISALRYAKDSVFIQSPDVNAQALHPELLATCRRGVRVSYIYCLGYNDAGEMLPLQGGHNEAFAHTLYKELEEKYHENLDIFVYVAKDQARPIHNSKKKRSCHIKLMIVDGHIGIMGSGNQDSQSWYHSQEVNIMVDSALMVGKWMEAVTRNQNSLQYGKVRKGNANEDKLVGCWVDPQTGEMAEGSLGSHAGHFSWVKGVVGAVQRVRGVGGF